MKRIPLTQGQFTLIDDIDFGWVSKTSWSAGKRNRKWYAVGLRSSYLHRLITKCPKGLEVDHINGDSLDNRRSNLRICSRSKNCKNKGYSRNNSSGFKGVHWNSLEKKWKVQITKDRKVFCIGSFTSKLEAARAYDMAARRLHGQFANLNFPKAKQ